MNCQKLFQDFNSSKFVVYTSLLLFFILFALRLDHAIIISWWLVFAPLWIWKFLVITGALVGVLVWICNPEYRQSESSYTHFKSMLISLSLQLLLLMFELLVCDKLENDRHFWTLAFIPLIFISLLSVAVSVWALKNERDFELELICSVNVLQFIFIALRLDRFITWSWVVVFVPLWILLCLAIIGVLYALIFAVILLRTPEVSLEQRKASLYTAIAYILIVIPLLIFFVLLSSKLDAKEFRSNFIGPSSLSSSEPTSMIHIYSHISYPISNQNSGNILSLSSTQHHHQSLSTPIPPLISHSSQSQPSSSFATSPFFSPNYSFDMDFFTVCVPLYFTLTILICMSFSSKGGNLWWFGMRKDFCSFLLILCPCLREYANISYNFNGVIPTTNNSLDDQNIRDQQQLQQQQQQQSLQNERTNLTSVQVDYDSTDTASGGLGAIGKLSSSGKKFNKKKSMLTNNKNGNNNLIIPNLLRLDLPD